MISSLNSKAIVFRIFFLVHIACSSIWAFAFSSYGLIRPGWTDSAWREETAYYWIVLFLLALFVLFGLVLIYFNRTLNRVRWAALILAPLIGMMIMREWYWDKYPPWDGRQEWLMEHGGKFPDYMLMKDEEYWELKRQEEEALSKNPELD